MTYQALLYNMSADYQNVFNSIDDGVSASLLRVFDLIPSLVGQTLQKQQENLNNDKSCVLFGVPYSGKGPYSAPEYTQMVLGISRLIQFLGNVAKTQRRTFLIYLLSKFKEDRTALHNLVTVRMLLELNLVATAGQWTQAKATAVANDIKAHVRPLLPNLFTSLIDDLVDELTTTPVGNGTDADKYAVSKEVVDKYLGETTAPWNDQVADNEWLSVSARVLLSLTVMDALPKFAKYNIPIPFAWIVLTSDIQWVRQSFNFPVSDHQYTKL